MKNASVTTPLALGVIKLRPACVVPELVIETGLLDIAGVSHVRVDSLRRRVQILYDGEELTAQRVVRFLEVKEWADAGTCRPGLPPEESSPQCVGWLMCDARRSAAVEARKSQIRR